MSGGEPREGGSGPPRLFLVAGEASGDLLGARLVAALREEAGGAVALAGVGGPRMAGEGLAPVFPADDIAVMGLFEVLPAVPRILRRLREAEKAALRFRPDAVVTIDAPGFSFRLGRRLGGRGIPLVHYVAPTVWAWKPGRARRIARFLDRVLTLLPFEPPYFERHGLPATFVGHPVVEEDRSFAPGAFRARRGIGASAPLLAVLPGSRRGELRRIAPVFGEALRELAARMPGLRAVVVAAPGLRGEAGRAFAGLPAAVVDREDEGFEACAAADAALAASGTATLELALARTPMVVAYRMAPATWQILRRMVRVEHACLVNLVLERGAVPEYLQGDARPLPLADAVEALLRDPAARARQMKACAEALVLLGEGGEPPSRRAARAVLAAARGSGRGRRQPEGDPT